ncbi:amidotransferase [Salipaludibacillus neizhouensis]|uniref:Amidotransferase n=1 Tax=Salipaludibacillus neizhouensis TaxID=885475 RepID=A0A3A9K5D2_9BACI|nr:gamma-glutamyl-gamma-aminobutyrate hydrolase family protein [Salipaludibacillus neizhouensis]RKL65662.1 amidotransferase [Salipaludibacillus neizhouensis]
MSKPMIAVLPLYDKAKESYWMLPGYMKGIEEAGGIPVIMSLTADEEDILAIAENFDGFLFTGGQDVNPNLYGEKNENYCDEICEKRDFMEGILFHHVLRLNKPAFGICRGLQLFNVLLGGTLYQDIAAQRPGENQLEHKQTVSYDQAVHHVYIQKDSTFYNIMKKEVIMVNSLHHQGIKHLADVLVPGAKSEDDLIEAVYMPGKNFVLAVQWHPEFNYHIDENSAKLFLEFVKSSELSLKITKPVSKI